MDVSDPAVEIGKTSTVGNWVLTLLFAIVDGIKAMRGERAAYPVIGRWARRLAGA